ncbi:MAG TPA: flagellar motor switch phosphatase FliY [Fervidobacterium sp.]|nr:flagellar motor switch phosphatase FliY [Fervidobacterium sp.]HPT53625.1 flagellar motor switch phosphatase FliY [Fervidobacterium sp.]
MMSDDFVSQEELDALLGQVESLTDIEKDMIGEIGNIILGSGATALSTILGRKVDISIPGVEVMTLGELRKGLSGEKVCVTIDFQGVVEGISVLVLEKETSAEIADIMMGGVGGAESTELDDFKLSAIGEAMNQMMGTAATSLSDMVKSPISITPPTIEIFNFSDLNTKFPPIGAESDRIAKVNFTMNIEDLEAAQFFLAMPVPFVRKLHGMISGPTVPPVTEPSEKPRQSPKPVNSTLPTADILRSEKEEKPTVAARPAQFEDFGKASSQTSEESIAIDERLQLLFDVPLNITVELGRTKLTLKEVMELGVGSLIELDKLTGEPVDVYVNNKLIAKGEVVVIDENFGVRITEIISPRERLYGLK